MGRDGPRRDAEEPRRVDRTTHSTNASAQCSGFARKTHNARLSGSVRVVNFSPTENQNTQSHAVPIERRHDRERRMHENPTQ